MGIIPNTTLGFPPAKSMDDFYMVLPSNSCPMTQPDNSAGKYIVEWENPIELEGTWKAALTEFTINYEPLNITDYDFIFFTYEREAFEAELHIVIENRKLSFEFVENDYLHKDINVYLENGKLGFFAFDVEVQPIFPSEEVRDALGYKNNTYPQSDGKQRTVKNIDTTIRINIGKGLKYTTGARFYEKLSIASVNDFFNILLERLPDDIKSLTLNKEGKVEIQFAKECIQIRFSKSLAKILGFQEYVKVESNTLISVRKVRITRPFDKLFIYVSITEPILIGGVYAPLIRMINVDKDIGRNDTLHIDVHNLMYIPMSSLSINSVEINIRDDSGEFIPFTYGTKSSLTLHVKKYE